MHEAASDEATRRSGERLAEEAYDSDSGGYNHCQAQEQRLAHLARDEAKQCQKKMYYPNGVGARRACWRAKMVFSEALR